MWTNGMAPSLHKEKGHVVNGCMFMQSTRHSCYVVKGQKSDTNFYDLLLVTFSAFARTYEPSFN